MGGELYFGEFSIAAESFGNESSSVTFCCLLEAVRHLISLNILIVDVLDLHYTYHLHICHFGFNVGE